ncbi:SGF29 tudor-like domain-containing protein [Halteromyces radiatus]|uniref:SGF29 tudor-like domain-containing protein n=1 Tax=Halteromyces radiatus TaxID=101107 RepID=UPI00221F48F3|nr:SGF29 tudor-like domain-containing protein [Halteromyces radiatus]KAI8086446.1 SGF29 tudor-like domain-containing protein [Halteromyces radiatus]
MDRKSRTSRSATLENSNEELNLWKQICSSLVELEHIQQKTETVVKNLNDMRSSLQPDQDITPTLLHRLKDHYRGGIELSSDEVKIITDVIEKLTVLTALREASETRAEQKRKKRKSEVEELKSVSPKKAKGSSDIYSPGTSVAARQPKQKDKNEEWILAIVLSFHADKNKYQVEDVEQDEYGQKQKYMLPPRSVIAVPENGDIKSIPEISPGEDVLALYPGTTCFYRAVVAHPPSSKDNNSGPSNYKVRFEDDNNEIKTVRKEHVLQIPKGKP